MVNSDAQVKGENNVKKITMIVVTVMMVVGLAASAFANPGWAGGQRYDDRGGYERSHDRYDGRDYRFRHDDWRFHRPPVVIHRIPEPVVYLPRPYVPAVGFFFPHMTIQIR